VADPVGLRAVGHSEDLSHGAHSFPAVPAEGQGAWVSPPNGGHGANDKGLRQTLRFRAGTGLYLQRNETFFYASSFRAKRAHAAIASLGGNDERKRRQRGDNRGTVGRCTLAAGLSSRRPLNEAWRRSRSPVRARYSICATSSGSTHTTPRRCAVVSAPAKGGAADLSGCSFFHNVRATAFV